MMARIMPLCSSLLPAVLALACAGCVLFVLRPYGMMPGGITAARLQCIQSDGAAGSYGHCARTACMAAAV